MTGTGSLHGRIYAELEDRILSGEWAPGSRIPFEQGSLSIHALSAAAIDKVSLAPGTDRAIRVEIAMNNSSGTFQVDELLKKKLKGSGLEAHVEIEVAVHEQEKRLLDRFSF